MRADVHGFEGGAVPQPAAFQPCETAPLRTATRLDALAGGFEPGRVAFIESTSPYLFPLTTSLCVAAAMDGEVVFVDGGNSIQPYAIARLCKARHIDARSVLSRIRVARAFTAHQLATLVDERLDAEVGRSGARTVIVSCMLGMFFDDGVPWNESFQLVRRCLEEVRAVARERNCRTVVTHFSPKPMSRRFGAMVSGLVDSRLRLRDEGEALVTESACGSEAFHVGQRRAQRTLDQFSGGWPVGPHAAHV
ncbi:MAG: hypothetical protein V1934_00620 [Methanobacteriota archaeon]